MFNYTSKIETEYIIDCLKSNIRQDNRTFDCYRDITFKKLNENGQVKVSLGNTEVISQIYSSLVSPNSSKPNEGFIFFSIDSSNLKHSAESNNMNEDLSELRNRISNLLEKSLKETK
jgi:exosome complex RNA-binding protein Rrp42 (RNase PH superfamily)